VGQSSTQSRGAAPLQVGESISHYKLLERVAEGGMGVVYKARDQRLDRLVALKFLAPDSQCSRESMERFLHEARAISQLNHPNIATIFDVGTEGANRFLAFEYLSGGTLRAKIRAASAEGSPFTIRQILSFGRQIGEALSHAHRHGIIHRDVKSENALLTEENTVKLTDFGLALVAGREAKTHTDGTAGTAAYMSPEQAQGLEVDARSDIFSFGVVLFEMATGHVPFHDRQEAVILYDIVHTKQAPLSKFRQDLPEGLQPIVSKALEKDPAERYQTVDELLRDLRSLSESLRATASRREPLHRPDPTIAVLPFVDMSPQKDQDFFCDGVTEEIINALTSVKGLKVVSRTSAFQFQGQAYDIREIGRQLGVQTVLEGSVRKAGSRLRITVQHINVSDGYHLWSQRYDREMEDVFAIQDEIAQAVVDQLRHKMEAEQPHAVPRKQTDNVEAYQCYLQGRYFLNQRTDDTLRKSLDCFRTAASKDRDYALAFAGLAEANILLAAGGYLEEPQAETLAKARDAAERALELDESCTEAHVSMGLVRFRADWDFQGAEREFLRALEINEGYASAHHHYAMLLSIVMRLDEAVAQIERARELDPLSLIISTAVARIYYFARRYEDSMAQGERTIALDPEFANAYFDLSISYAQQGKFEKAEATVSKLAGLTENRGRALIFQCRVEAEKGNREKALGYYAELQELSKTQRVVAYVWAILDVGLHEFDRAVTWLEQAYEERDPPLLYIQCEHLWDPLRSRPDFQELVRKIGFPVVK
jgi:serine/threonine protein kinase/tetratricopeptide (TPR) repeat protein